MYKNKKIAIKFITCIFILLTLIEVLIYMLAKNNLFGLIYIIFNLLIIFLLVPISYNYNRYYSPARLSKLVIVIILGIFSSYLLNLVVLKNMSYIDNSKEYINKIFIIRSILKGLIYLLLIGFTALEFKLDKLLKKINKNIAES